MSGQSVNPKEYALDLRNELRLHGMPPMEMRCRFYEDGWLSVDIWSCGNTGFTLVSGYPGGQNYAPKEVAKDIHQTFQKYS